MKATKDTAKILSANLFPVVGIGASAGGLDAFKRLLMAIPEKSGIAYVLVQHLDPNHESMLPELLQKVTKVPVLEISDDIRVEPDHIYIIPSNKMLRANDGVLQLSPRETSKNERNLPIDLFFTSLAEIHQEHAIGVVLSGTASDGTLGLKAIKDHGGITFAQDEVSAIYESMPNSAILAGVVDFVLAPEEIPRKLLEIIPHISRNDDDLKDAPMQDEEVFKQILALLRIRKGTDFTHYKQTTIRRRILRRMAINKQAELAAYLKYLRENKTEQDVLYQDLLIPVTSFFRDEKCFDTLIEKALPLIEKNTIVAKPIRVWVAGCSTGEEAYSIAICFKEFLRDKSSSTAALKDLDADQQVQIFATDISEPAIAKARAGIYSKNDVAGLTPKRLQEFFTPTHTGFQANKQLRDMCVFAVHNFLKDPPFGKMDLISCRNVLIYLEPYLQKKALTTFHYALNPKGFLLLGKSETSSSVPNLFNPFDKRDKLFTRKDVPGKVMHVTSQRSEQIFHDLNVNPNIENIRMDFQKTADDIMLSKYTPAGVVVNEELDIVHFRGATSAYLEQLPGKPSHNLLKMAKMGLAFELRNIIHKAKKEKTTIVKENIPVVVNNIQQMVSIEAVPLPNVAEPHYLVLFHDRTFSTAAPNPEASSITTSAKKEQNDKDLRIEQLEHELVQAREDMHSISEDQEAANEELQSANEELLSGGEELQSLNEELETSKEELQSTNEELTIVNQELVGLNEQLTEARDFSEAIVATIREPLLVLDKDLRIKNANNSFYKTFQVTQRETEGSLIYEMSNRQWDVPALRTLLEKILPEKTKITDFEVKHSFPSAGERVFLFNALEMKTKKAEEKSILLAIEDITERKRSQDKESELLNRFQNLVKQAPVAICILKGKDYTVELANDFYLQLVEKEKDLISKPFFESSPELKTQGIKEILDTVLQSGTPYYGNEFELHLSRNKKSDRGFFNFVYQPYFEQGNTVSGIIVIVAEVTEQIIARRKMEAQASMVQNLLMTAPGFVCTMTGPDHVYGLVNERYQQLFGKRKIQGKPILVALPELEGQGFVELLDKVYKTGESYLGIEIPISLARDENLSPELRYFNFSYQPMFDENKKIYSILVFGYEVTDQVIAKNKIQEIHHEHTKELEEKVQQRTQELSGANESLLRKNQELVKLNKELESFAYVSSHDLQEPLRKIRTFANRILEMEYSSLSEKGKDYFNRMQNSAKRMQALIQDLLIYSRATKTERRFEKTDLNKIVAEVKNEFQEIIQEKNAILVVHDLCEAAIIPFQFRQMIQNLISNALKFSSPEKQPRIEIKSEIATGSELRKTKDAPANLPEHMLPNEKSYCHISVSDNGIGFEPAYKDKIFEVFQRLHDRDIYPGTGIGLAIVKKIVENHDGFIMATSELSKGATFDIYLPVPENNGDQRVINKA